MIFRCRERIGETQFGCSGITSEHADRIGWRNSVVLPQFQMTSHSKNLRELKYVKFNQNYRENYKDL